MPPVLITCPESGALVPTGAHVDDTEDLDHLPDQNMLIDCPDCGLDHVWTREDAAVAQG